MAFEEMDKIVARFFDHPAFNGSVGSRREERAERWMSERYGDLMDLCMSGKREEGGWYERYTASARDDAIAYLIDTGSFQEISEAFEGKPEKGYQLYVNYRVEHEAEQADRNGVFDE
jgi:hypothetical protein